MKQSIGKFLNYANQNNIHGTAIVAYHSVYNDIVKNRDSFKRETVERIDNLAEIIDNEINNNPLLSKHGDEFLKRVEKLFPNSLHKRVSLASQGAVNIETVKPRSIIARLFVFINQFLKNLDS